MIDLAVFDMAGTTVTDKDFVAKAFQKAFWNQKVKISEAEVNPFMGYPKPIAIQMVLENAGVESDGDLVQKIHEDFVSGMIDFYEDSPYVQPMPDAEDLFFYLQEKGVCIVLNTGFSRDIAEVIVNRFQWTDRGLVDDFIGSDEVEQGRPFADMIKTLKGRNGFSEDAIVMKVGDTVVDILEGKAAGCKYVIAVTTGAASKEELAAYNPTHIIAALSEIPAILRQEKQQYV